MTPCEAALAYAEKMGWPVFPRPDGRWIGHGYKDATSDASQIREWWHRWPQALIGSPTGIKGCGIVLDVDLKNGKNGFDTLEMRWGKATLPVTPTAHTPNGGNHYFFKPDPYFPIHSSIGEKGLGLGLDVKGEGGSVALPTPGWRYRWDEVNNLKTVAFYPVPHWFAAKPLKKQLIPFNDEVQMARWRDRLDLSAEAIRQALPGERHDVLVRHAFKVGAWVAEGFLQPAVAIAELGKAMQDMVKGTGGNLAHACKDLEQAYRAGREKGSRNHG